MPVHTTTTLSLQNGVSTSSPAFPAQFRSLSSARIRWQGWSKDIIDTQSWTNSRYSTGSITIPSVGSGYTFSHHELAFYGANVNNNPFEIDLYVYANLFGQEYVSYSGLVGNGGTHSYGNSRTLYVYSSGGCSLSMNGTVTSAELVATTYGYKVTGVSDTTTPKATFYGVEVAGPASLADNEWSMWYDITNAEGQTSLPFTNSIGGSNRARAQLELTYHTWAGTQQTMLFEI